MQSPPGHPLTSKETVSIFDFENVELIITQEDCTQLILSGIINTCNICNSFII